MFSKSSPSANRVCLRLVRNMGGSKGVVHGAQLYKTAKAETRYGSHKFKWDVNHQTGVSWDKPLGKEEVKLLSYIDKHPHKTKPIVITDRVHDITEVVPGVSIGPQFWDGQSGNTLTEGNMEAVKINNFLHLTPPMIRLHTEHLKALCTAAPPKPEQCLEQFTTNYVYHSSSLKHPLSREASLRLNIKDLALETEVEGFLRDLVSANQNIKLKDLHPKTYEWYRLPKILRDLPVLLELDGDMLTIHAKQCPTRKQNLSLCYYRLSGFIQEAIDLKPIHIELRLNKMETDFVFDQEDEAVLRFEENNFVEIHRDQDGGITGLTGSPKAVTEAKDIILEIASDVVCQEFEIPQFYRNYITEHCNAFKEILSTHEALYTENCFVTFSDTIQNVIDDLESLISSLVCVTVPCPNKIAPFVLSDRFISKMSSDFDSLITEKEGAVEVIISREFQTMAQTLVTAQIRSAEESVETKQIACTVSDINWDKLSAQFGAHAEVSKDSVTITAPRDIVREIGIFIKQKDYFTRTLRTG